jgi:hypothetical protein
MAAQIRREGRTPQPAPALSSQQKRKGGRFVAVAQPGWNQPQWFFEIIDPREISLFGIIEAVSDSPGNRFDFGDFIVQKPLAGLASNEAHDFRG